MDMAKVGIEIGILAFFALLYYLFQRRRITRYHQKEILDAFALWVYDYHTYLESIKDKPHYQSLNSFVMQVEELNLENHPARLQLMEQIPETMPSELKERLIEILSV